MMPIQSKVYKEGDFIVVNHEIFKAYLNLEAAKALLQQLSTLLNTTV